MLTRVEFAQHFDEVKHGLGQPDSPLWCPEENGDPSNWFVCVKPIGVSRFRGTYWNWCNTALQGQVKCYSSDSDNSHEWWGFTDQKDIPIWMLKWM